jgi:hypothetical protein
MQDVVFAVYKGDYRIKVTFEDCKKGIRADLLRRIQGEPQVLFSDVRRLAVEEHGCENHTRSMSNVKAPFLHNLCSIFEDEFS